MNSVKKQVNNKVEAKAWDQVWIGVPYRIQSNAYTMTFIKLERPVTRSTEMINWHLPGDNILMVKA